jgi:Mn-dependent DtxR family transcriptional regulator
MKGKNNPEFVYRLINRADDRTKIMMFFQEQREPVHMRELARILQIEINAARRELLILTRVGYLTVKNDGIYKLFSKQEGFVFENEFESIFKKINGHRCITK